MATRSVSFSPQDVEQIAQHFELNGTFRNAQRFGSGHINDTFLVTFDQAGATVRYVFQRINHSVFRNVPHLMDNIGRVTAHLVAKIDPAADPRSLTLLPTRTGQAFYKTDSGDFWRVYQFIKGARTYDTIDNLTQAYEAARAFGQFQQALVDLGGERLHETIPHFHDTPWRFQMLKEAAEADVVGRKKQVATELEFAFAREPEVGRLLDLARRNEIPERITHNDTKLNNVMLDNQTGMAVCVIDLDTVMPGLSLYDFGDLVRSATNTAAEDERDLSKVNVSLPAFDAIVRGYASAASDILTPAEWAHLVFAGKLITYEVGIRFLTDYLQGDIYFKTKDAEHNLFRARNQFRLVARIEEAAVAMNQIVRNHNPNKGVASNHVHLRD